MINEADAVVIGAGAFGCSTALHLSKLGLGRVALVDRFEPASQTSPKAAGLFKSIQKTQLLSRLAQLSMQKVAGFEDEMGFAVPFVRSGSLTIAETPELAEVLREKAAHARQWGAELEMIDSKEARNRMPLIETLDAEAVCHTFEDVYIEEPSSLLRAYIEAGERMGMVTVPNAPVTGIRTRDGAVEAVVTDEGEISTPVVVDAAGAWARMVAKGGGAELPVVPVRHQLFITDPIEGTEPAHPILRFVDSAIYIRTARGGLMLGGFERDPLVVDPRDSGPDFSVEDVPLDMAPLDTMASAVEEKIPDLRSPGIAELRGGLFTMTPDGGFLVGPVPSVEGLWTLTGCNGSGFSFSPALGQLLAEWVIEGEPSVDLSELRPGRFSQRSRSEEELRDAGVRQYETSPSEEELRDAAVHQYAHYY
jgi:glycine/D-amino acid oxidase-like deaminating enzyme